MIIISQDKTMITKEVTFGIGIVDQKECIYNFPSNRLFGKYKDENRTREVFEELCSAIIRGIDIFCMPKE